MSAQTLSNMEPYNVCSFYDLHNKMVEGGVLLSSLVSVFIAKARIEAETSGVHIFRHYISPANNYPVSIPKHMQHLIPVM